MKIEYPNSYTVWDLETSGLDKTKNEILEIGCVKVHKGEITERHSWLLNHGIEIPKIITEITGITKESIDKDGIDPKEALTQFLKVLPFSQDVTHLTHNGMKFDIPWLVHHVSKVFGLAPEQRNTFTQDVYRNALDTAVFVKAGKLYLDRRWNETFRKFSDRVMEIRAYGVKYNVAICCQELGIDKAGIEQHRALGDVELTHEIYKKLMAKN